MRDGLLDDESTVSLPKKRGAGERAPRLVPALTLISHPVTQRVGERLLLEELLAGREVPLSRKAPEFLRAGESQGTPLADPCVSRKPIVFAPGEGGRVRLRVEEGGTQVVAGEPIVGGREFGPEELASGIPLELAERVVLLLHLVEPETDGPQDSLGMVGQSPSIRRVRMHIQKVAELQEPVLIRGETGTGKELVAQAIHQHSTRRDERFVSVNLGAIPKELATAELFGVKKDAFTGATRDREGFFRAAQGGTLFLDEVGEASPEVQVMLLRVLESREMYPVGGHTPIPTNVRLVAATDANLEEQIRDGRFKAPLMHRLAGYEIRLPPLRERREDIGLLFFHFAREALEALGEAWRLEPEDPQAEPWLPAALAARLVRYSWPGNIRQLRNLTRQLVIANRGQPQLRVDPQLEKELGSGATPSGRPLRVAESLEPRAVAPDSEPRATPRRKPSDITEQELLTVLRAQAWDLKRAADHLGIPRPSIYDLIDKSPNIRTAGDLTPEEISHCYRECEGDLDAMVRRLEVSKRALRRRINELGLDS
ncbi:sigma 54-interacting transcriptional regulator [Archangium lansingense]|uniref:Sigma-54 dependent transcriptional regulator n=1 Tax=Archangium lansingense TaxID=2995310 RepID=A0ABT3ZWV3_9BACT|nr:sigma-54 dependent transcriptional regulator [Archangium lansinium]MCY1073863.1 sigma-54 dependent transcriptional regulator [Archangium lansinium]